MTVQWLTQRSTDAKKARAFYVVLVLCADWWVSRSVVNRADGMVVVWLVQWYKTSGADRFTAPYARTPPHPPRPLLPRQSPVEKGSQAEIKGIRQ